MKSLSLLVVLFAALSSSAFAFYSCDKLNEMNYRAEVAMDNLELFEDEVRLTFVRASDTLIEVGHLNQSLDRFIDATDDMSSRTCAQMRQRFDMVSNNYRQLKRKFRLLRKWRPRKAEVVLPFWRTFKQSYRQLVDAVLSARDLNPPVIVQPLPVPGRRWINPTPRRGGRRIIRNRSGRRIIRNRSGRVITRTITRGSRTRTDRSVRRSTSRRVRRNRR